MLVAALAFDVKKRAARRTEMEPCQRLEKSLERAPIHAQTVERQSLLMTMMTRSHHALGVTRPTIPLKLIRLSSIGDKNGN